MEPRQALVARTHIEILKKRVDHLEQELKRVQSVREDADLSIDQWEKAEKFQDAQYTKRIRELEAKFKRDREDLDKQIKLTRIMVDQKKEERDTLLEALKQTKFMDTLDGNLQKINWHSIKMKALELSKPKTIELINSKARPLSELLNRAKDNMKELIDVKESVMDVKMTLESKHSDIKTINSRTSNLCYEKEEQIQKCRSEIDRLRLLIKQCAISDEPISDFVTHNIRVKYRSFLDSKNPKDLEQGLEKFSQRQAKMIGMLRYMESKLTRDCNLLQVAADQTADHTQYYHDLRNQEDAIQDIDFSLPNNHLHSI